MPEKEYQGLMMAIMMAQADFEKKIGCRPNRLIIGLGKVEIIARAHHALNGKDMTGYPPPMTIYGMRVSIDENNEDALQVAYASNVPEPMSFEDIHDITEE